VGHAYAYCVCIDLHTAHRVDTFYSLSSAAVAGDF